MSLRPFNPHRSRGLAELAGGLLLIAAGIVVVVLAAPGASIALQAALFAPIVAGALVVVRGLLHVFPDDLAADDGHARAAPPPLGKTLLEVGGGLVLVIVGSLYATRVFGWLVPDGNGLYERPEVRDADYVVYAAAVGGGLLLLAAGIADTLASVRRMDLSATLGYRTFVAWRYLLVFKTRITVRARAALLVGASYLVLLIALSWFDIMHPVAGIKLGQVAQAYLALVVFWGFLRYSKPATWLFVIGVMLAIGGGVATLLLSGGDAPTPFAPRAGHIRLILQILSIAQLVGAGLAALAMLFGTLRAFFTFFTTVPIGGVWIGTAALVCVLSVMSGFETDLRTKILGSNAHIQITREDGEFVDWREAKAKLDKIPGIVASTPYATSEVVIAANNNGMNVIIKGIDPATVGSVTNLIAALEDPEAMQRLEPLIDEEGDRGAPLAPTPSGGVDPPPSDLPAGGEPIDFSSTDAPPADAGADVDLRPDDTQLGTADAGAPLPPELLDAITADRARGPADLDAPPPPALDPPPDDLPIADGEPIDYTEPDAIGDPAIAVSDELFEPTLSRRTQALPGILVGRELVKQTHLYNGQEVRVVSPLSDPSNPDATGTPIPFNRDYRVAGVFFTGMYEYDLKYVYVTLDSLQDFLDRGDAVDGIEVRIRDADDTDRYVPTEEGPGLIREALGPGYRVQDWRELNRSLFSALKLEKIAMFLVLGIVILVASFSIVGNLIMVVVEKQREIALLKTLGASDTGVTHVFAVQGLIIGVIGTVLGVATGLAGCWAGKKYGLPLNPDVYYIDRLPIHVDPESVLAAALAGVVISIAATLYPALLAARVRPAAGMRH